VENVATSTTRATRLGRRFHDADDDDEENQRCTHTTVAPSPRGGRRCAATVRDESETDRQQEFQHERKAG